VIKRIIPEFPVMVVVFGLTINFGANFYLGIR